MGEEDGSPLGDRGFLDFGEGSVDDNAAVAAAYSPGVWIHTGISLVREQPFFAFGGAALVWAPVGIVDVLAGIGMQVVSYVQQSGSPQWEIYGIAIGVYLVSRLIAALVSTWLEAGFYFGWGRVLRFDEVRWSDLWASTGAGVRYLLYQLVSGVIVRLSDAVFGGAILGLLAFSGVRAWSDFGNASSQAGEGLTLAAMALAVVLLVVGLLAHLVLAMKTAPGSAAAALELGPIEAVAASFKACSGAAMLSLLLVQVIVFAVDFAISGWCCPLGCCGGSFIATLALALPRIAWIAFNSAAWSGSWLLASRPSQYRSWAVPQRAIIAG